MVNLEHICHAHGMQRQILVYCARQLNHHHDHFLNQLPADGLPSEKETEGTAEYPFGGIVAG